MFLNAKRISFLGLLLACTVILVILSGVLEFNTLFLLALASFGVGIAIRECGLRLGFGFLIASILLSFMLSFNKLYCITYSGMAIYVYIMEFTWEKLTYLNAKIKRIHLYWIIKYLTFNLMYIPVIIFLPKLIYQGEISTPFLGLLIAGGQIALFIFDKAYIYFQKTIWGKIRGKLDLK